ncbi:hypothetical protein D9M71_595040 [compost metagenome]
MVGDVQLPLAHQRPVVSVGAAVEQAVFVDGAKAAGAVGMVVADGGCTAHPAVTRQVLPGLGRLQGRVDERMDENDLAALATRLEGPVHTVGVSGRVRRSFGRRLVPGR